MPPLSRARYEDIQKSSPRARPAREVRWVPVPGGCAQRSIQPNAPSADHAAAGDLDRVVVQHGAPQRQQFAHTWIGHAVVDLFPFAPGLHETAPAQTPEMGRDTTLRGVYGGYQLAHTALASGCLGQQLQEADACGIA